MLETEEGRYKPPGPGSSSGIPWENLLENTLTAETVLEEHPLGFLAYGLGRRILI